MTQDELIKTYWADIVRVTGYEAYRWRVDQGDVDDILQSTLQSLYESPVHLEGARDVESLFIGSVLTHVKQVLWRYRGFRSNGKIVGRVQLDNESSPVGLFQPLESEGSKMIDDRMLPLMPSAEDEYFHEHRYDALWANVDGLGGRQAEAVALRYREALSVAEIAAQMGLTELQVQRAVSEGLRKLRQKLNPGQKSYPRAKLNENRKAAANG